MYKEPYFVIKVRDFPNNKQQIDKIFKFLDEKTY